MRVIPRIAVTVVSLSLAASVAQAQSLSIGLRGTGSFPTGDFADAQSGSSAAVAEGARNGFGYGLDVGVGFGPLGVYGGFDHINFDCETSTCQTDGKYTLQGVTVGLKLTPSTSSSARPYIKGGVTFNELKSGFGGSSSNRFTTDRAPGYEIGLGADISVLGLLNFSPQVRYVGQNLKAKIPGVSSPDVDSQGVTYLTFDLGLSVHSPFGGR